MPVSDDKKVKVIYSLNRLLRVKFLIRFLNLKCLGIKSIMYIFFISIKYMFDLIDI